MRFFNFVAIFRENSTISQLPAAREVSKVYSLKSGKRKNEPILSIYNKLFTDNLMYSHKSGISILQFHENKIQH